MRYFVGYLVEGEAAQYYEKITADLAGRFGVKNLAERIMPHLTLKAPFESQDILPLERTLESIARSMEIVPFEIDGFGHFENNETVYLSVTPNQALEARATEAADLIAAFGDNRQEIPRPFRPHISIAKYLKQDSFTPIWGYLSKLARPHFLLNFDAIMLAEHENGLWRTRRVFRKE